MKALIFTNPVNLKDHEKYCNGPNSFCWSLGTSPVDSKDGI